MTSLEEMISVRREDEASANVRATDISNLIPVKGKERKAEAPAETKNGGKTIIPPSEWDTNPNIWLTIWYQISIVDGGRV